MKPLITLALFIGTINIVCSQSIFQYENLTEVDITYNAIQKYKQAYIIAGNEGNKIIISELNSDGTIASTKKITLADEDIFPGIMTMLVDSDEKIVVAGYRQNLGGTSKAFILKFDYINEIVDWSIIFDNEGSYFHHVIEKSPGGNYLLCGQNIAVGNNQEAAFFEVNRTTGAFTTLTNINQGSNAETFYSIAINEAEYVLASRLTIDEGTSKMRACKTVTNSAGAIMSNKTYIANPASTSARLYAFNVKKVDDGIYMLIHGAQDNTETNKDLFVLKTNLSGEIQWLKKYDFTNYEFDGSWNSIREDDGNIFLTGNLKDASLDEKGNIFIINIDSDGNTIWSNSYNFETNYAYNHQDFLIANSNYLIGVGSIYDDGASVYSGAAIFINQANGLLSTDCYQTEPIEVSDLTIDQFDVVSESTENTFDFAFPTTSVSTSSEPVANILCQYVDVSNLVSTPVLKLYPNPAQNAISILLPEFNNNNYSISIITLNGKSVTINNKDVVCSDGGVIINLNEYKLPNGIYQIILKSNNFEYTSNFVIFK